MIESLSSAVEVGARTVQRGHHNSFIIDKQAHFSQSDLKIMTLNLKRTAKTPN